MNKFFRGLLSVSLCFCLICSICGVSFAAEDGGALSLPPDAGGGDASDITPPDPGGDVPDPVLPDTGGTAPDPVPPDSGGDAPDPVPPDTGGDVPDPVPPDPGGDTPDTPPDPGGDVPDPDAVPSDPGADSSDPPSGDVGGGSGGLPALPPGDVTYITLPEDYVIKSSTLEGTYAIDPQSALAPVVPSNTSGLKSVLLSILGNYDPIVAEYQYVGSGSYNNYIREIQPDYVWLTSAAIFAILLYSTWRLLGGLICKM